VRTRQARAVGRSGGLRFRQSGGQFGQRGQVGLGHTPTRAFALSTEQVIEAGLHDVVRLVCAEIFSQGRTGPGDGPCLGQQSALKRREVAQADKARSVFNRPGQGAVGQIRQDAGQSVAAARDERHIGAAGRRPANGGQPDGVIACKTHVTGQRRLIDLHFMAQLLQAPQAATELAQ